MIILNITFATDPALAPGLVDFLKETVIPAAINDGMHSIILSRINAHDPEDKDQAKSFALQMRASSENEFEEFTQNTAPALFGLIAQKWGTGVVSFGTRLDVLHDTNRDL